MQDFSTLSLSFNPLNPELNPICHLLAFLGVHHILHVSRIRIKLPGQQYYAVSLYVILATGSLHNVYLA
jgi:hypothetical protein